MELVNSDDPYLLKYRVWENEALKFLHFDNWDVEAAYSRIKGKNDYFLNYGFPI
jgi:hypothetical protein